MIINIIITLNNVCKKIPLMILSSFITVNQDMHVYVCHLVKICTSVVITKTTWWRWRNHKSNNKWIHWLSRHHILDNGLVKLYNKVTKNGTNFYGTNGTHTYISADIKLKGVWVQMHVQIIIITHMLVCTYVV